MNDHHNHQAKLGGARSIASRRLEDETTTLTPPQPITTMARRRAREANTNTRANVFVCHQTATAAGRGYYKFCVASGGFVWAPRALRKSGAKLERLRLALGVLLALTVALLSMAEVEAIKLQPEGREKFYWSGEQFIITCQNNNNIKNVKIRWIGPNGLDITDDRSQRVHAESTGPHGNKLMVMNASAGVDDGQYKCTIGSTDDRNPREHIEFNLKLYRSTSFKDTPRQLVMAAGQVGHLVCRVEFDPSVVTATVSWFRDHKPIEMFNDSQYQAQDYDQSRQESRLVISPVSKHHDGTYTCRAEAVNAQLSKISEHDIQLETNYAPTFERDSHTVWVERGGSSHGRHLAQQQQTATGPGGNTYRPGTRGRHSKHHQQLGPAAGRRPSSEEDLGGEQQQQSAVATATTTLPNGQQVVRVELRCSCQANPAATILWFSSANSIALAKGEPIHILEEPRMEQDGHNTSSTLVLGYSLDVDWPHRTDQYICSATNRLGKANKVFKVEQGDPPPAFNVGPHRHYNPQTTAFRFTLLGPNFDPDATFHGAINQQPQQEREILPPVDAFRIRAEQPGAAGVSLGAAAEPKSRMSHAGSSRGLENSVQISLAGMVGQTGDLVGAPNQRHQQLLPQQLSFPRNFTVNLGRLPSGQQRLFLEAHNAVGWSPNSTYLGEYNIVSGAASAGASLHCLLWPLIALVSLHQFARLRQQ